MAIKEATPARRQRLAGGPRRYWRLPITCPDRYNAFGAGSDRSGFPEPALRRPNHVTGSVRPPVPFRECIGDRQMIESGKTILVVEDDREVREVALAVLEAASYRVLEAANGDDALRLLQAHPDLQVDVLFTDVVMPGRLDGVDLAKVARELRPELHVLFATGFANLVRSNRDLDIEGPVLRKPYRPIELRRAVTALLCEVG
jgi:CheY-like chemotaxis protein